MRFFAAPTTGRSAAKLMPMFDDYAIIIAFDGIVNLYKWLMIEHEGA
jgi:hypothetical protein